MPGTLLQLVAIGSEDTYITGNPKMTFFKSVFKKYSNFSMENIDRLFIGKDILNYDKPTKLFIDIPNHAHLIGNMCLELDLPDIFSETNGIDQLKISMKFGNKYGC